MRSVPVAKRLIKQVLGDKRSIALLFIAPIFVLTLLSLILNTTEPTPKLITINAPNSLVNILETEAIITVENDEKSAMKKLEHKEIDGIVKYDNNALIIIVEGSEPSITKVVLESVNKSLGQLTSDVLGKVSKVMHGRNLETFVDKPEVVFINGSKNMTTFDAVAPMFMGFFVFFFVFMIAGVSFLRERISGTLERIMATPLKRKDIVLGYFMGFGVFVSIQTLIIQLFMIYGLNITIKGSFFTVLLINLVLAAGSLSLGTLLSAFAKNEFQLFQFIPIIIVPQVLFSGIFNLRESHKFIVVISKFFPMTYGAEALRDVAIGGKSLVDVQFYILILTIYAILFIILNILALKKYREI